ncbi:MAG: RluA family pseudouridine synthase [Planctomycetaceae bacterium]|nr:RluA family pseudouridine synthase [Planctomycetaceae bacterium]
MHVLYEDNHLLALVKPAGLATMGLPQGEETLLTQAKEYLKWKYNKPGEVYLGVVSRLDVPVSGVVLFARTSKAAARLNEQFRTHTVEKIYLAIVEGKIVPPEHTLTGYLKEDERHRKVFLTKQQDGKEVILHYKTVRQVASNTFVEVKLETGRKHQIRIQLSSHGFPILGDRKYGSRVAFSDEIALHAHRLIFSHPIADETGKERRIELTAPLPETWKKFV